MTWILIFFLKSGYGAGMIEIEYPTEASCETAAAELMKEHDGFLSDYAWTKCLYRPTGE